MAKKNETNHTLTDIEESYLLLMKHGLNPEPMGKVPFYDSGVPCGIPTDLGDLQDQEFIELPMELIRMGVSICISASGRSMIDCGIQDGDQLAVKLQPYAKDGDIVVAYLDGGLTVKAFFEDDDGNKWLIPQNDDFSPICISEYEDARIVGVVLGVNHPNPGVSYRECKKRIRNARLSSPVPLTKKKVASAIKAVLPMIGNSRQWYSVYRVLADRGVIANGDFPGFVDYIDDIMGEDSPQLSAVDLNRLSVNSFSRPLSLWNENDAPVTGKRFEDYLAIAQEFKKNLD